MLGVRLKDVWKKYGPLEALKGVTFECQRGQFFSLLGPSGAGKTSILKMIAGVEEVTAGEIYVDDRLYNDVRPQERDIAMMFENYALYPHLTVFENMASPYRSSARKSEHSSDEVERIIRETARLLSIEELLDRYPKALSGGQKQRAALGRTLVRRPSVFLLDEPISHLDAKLRHNMRTELKKIHEEFGASFIYATPDYLEAISMADIIALINQGEIQQIGTPGEIYHHPVNEFVAGFIGDPAMNLFDCLLQSENSEVTLRMGSHGIALPQELATKLQQRKTTGDCRAGIQPTNIHVAMEKTESSSIPAELYLTEPLGRYTIVTVRVDPVLLKVKMRGQLGVKEGETVWLSFDADRFHFFERETRVALAIT